MSNHALDVIQVNNPCPADWNAMAGDQRSRFCSHRQKHMHDLSQMTRSEAEDLMCKSGGNLCVRFSRDSAGTVVTLDYEPTKKSRRWVLWTACAGILATAGTALGIWNQSRMVIVQGALPAMLPPPPAATSKPSVQGGVRCEP